MIERNKTEAGRKSATMPNQEVPLVGNNGNLNRCDSQVSSAGNVVVSENISPTETRQNGGELAQGSVLPQVNSFPYFHFNFLHGYKQVREPTP